MKGAAWIATLRRRFAAVTWGEKVLIGIVLLAQVAMDIMFIRTIMGLVTIDHTIEVMLVTGALLAILVWSLMWRKKGEGL